MQSAGIYTVTSIINMAIPFLLLPVLTRYMSPSDYGIVAMFGVLVSFVSPFTGLSVQGAVQRQYYEREHVHLPTYIANCLLILVVSSTLAFLLLFIFAEPISKVSSFPENWMWIVVIVPISGFINSIIVALWQVRIKPYTIGKYQIAQTLLNIGLSLLLVVSLGMAWEGRIEAQLITAVIFTFIGFVILKKEGWLKFKFNKQYIRNALCFGVPLVPHALGGVIMTMTDRFFITSMVGLEATGLYAVGYMFGMIICFVESSFNQAYVPWLYERLKNNDDQVKRNIVKVTYVYFLCIILLALSVSLIAPWFLTFFVGEKFAGAHVYVFWIAIGYAFSGMYKMVANYIFFAEKTHILAWSTLFCGGLNIMFNYILIKRNGAIGAAQSMCLTFLIFFVMTWVLSATVYKMPWLLRRVKTI